MPDDNARRMELQSRILDLSDARDAAPTAAQKQALLTQIEALERLVDDIDLGQADALGARVDAIVASLEQIQGAQPLDAASALGRAIHGLRGMRQGPGEGGG
jgi:hypothetical protein